MHTHTCRSLSGLGHYVSTLEAKRKSRTSEEQSEDDPMGIENGRSLGAESKMNGLPEEKDKDYDVIQPTQKTVQSEDSSGRGQTEEIDNSIMMESGATQDNSNRLSAEYMAAASMEVDENKNGEKNGTEQVDLAGGGGRRKEELNPSQTNSKRPRRKASSNTAKPKAASQVRTYEDNI